MITAHHREPVNVNRRSRLGTSFRGLMGMLVGSLLLAACAEDDPRYPVYYSYRVDVKVDGVPVTIERVIKCMGTLVTDWEVSPGTKTGGDYANPPLIGAYVPGTSQAVYTPVPNACLWASATPEQIEEDKKQVHRFLVPPLTPENKYLPPDSKLPVLWASDDKTFGRMEYYVSKRALSGQDSHVEFIQAYPPEIVDEAAFEASEKRAETESPDLTPFFFPRDQNAAKKLKLYKERRLEPGMLVISVCHAAWRIPRSEWSKVPGLDDWVSTLPNDGRAYLISKELWPLFTKAIPFKGGRNSPSLGPVGYAPKDEHEKVGRFATYETIHPVMSTDKGRYVDLERAGSFGCTYEVMHPNRAQTAREMSVDRSTKPTASYPMKLETERLYAQFTPELNPVYVRELDEFIVFISRLAGGKSIDEPVVKGWKE